MSRLESKEPLEVLEQHGACTGLLLRRAEVDVVERAWLVAAYWVSGYQDC